MIGFLAGGSCMNKGDQQWWECGLKKDCYLTSMDYLCHLLLYKRGDDGTGMMMWMKRRRENLRGRRIWFILAGT